MRAAAHRGHVAVAGDHADLLERHAEPLGHALREARLVSLAGGQRADHDVHAAFRPHGDLRPLAWIARVELDVVRHADAAMAPAPARRGATGLEALPVGHLHGALLRRRVVTAVVDEADRVA